jgi:hypothetical protein
MRNEHMVEKTIRNYDIKKALSDYMKSLGYKALQGSGGDIAMSFRKSRNSEVISFDEVIFQVQDSLNPEPEQIYISKKEAIELIARVRKIDLTNSDISITS